MNRDRKPVQRWTRMAVVIFLLSLSSVSPTSAAEFHVTADGSGSGTGSLQNPWDLQTALDQPAQVQPGDTIWIHGGVYAGYFQSRLTGTPSAPILVRNYRGQAVRIVTPEGIYQVPLTIAGDYTWFWGLEITSTVTSTATANISNVYLAGTLPDLASGNKLINCIIHNATGNGIGDQSDAEGTEVYGCIIYNNGRTTINDNYAYGIYGQNFGMRKYYSSNIILNNFGNYQFHLFTENSEVDSFTLKHNVAMSTVSDANLVFNDESSESNVIDTNYFYGPGPLNRLLYTERKALQDPIIRGNYFIRGRLSFRELTGNRVFLDNINYGNDPLLTSNINPTIPFDTSTVPGNTWYIAPEGETPPRPGGVWVNLVRNTYESSRSHIVIYNWDLLDSVSIDLSPVVPAGTWYAVVDAQNYFGPPVFEGEYAAGSISLPMTLTGVSTPVTYPPARGTPVHTGREFGVFVVKLAAPRGALTANPDTLEKGGGDVRLQWTSDGATEASLNFGIGPAPTSGSRLVTVTESRTYVLTLQGPGGVSTDSVFIYVRTDAPDSPVLSEPLNASSAVNVPTTLGWNSLPNATAYHLQISGDDTFQQLIVNDTTYSSSTVQFAGLPYFTELWWRTRAKGLTGLWGGFSPVWQFRTELGPPVLRYPANGAVDVPNMLSLTWDSARGATRYHLQVVKDSIEMIEDDTTITGTSYYFQILEKGALFEWRVRSRNAEEWSDFSPPWSFRTTTTSVEQIDEGPAEYSLDQNYPNPFNPSTIFSFALPVTGRATLAVYDLLGRELAKPVDETLAAGRYTASFSADGLAAGVYYYRLTAGSFSRTRKMVLLR